MKALGSSLVAILRAATGGTAYAQIYKWGAEAGKTPSSDHAPADGKKPDTVADRISVYAPDPALLARAAAPAGSNPVLSARVDRLERQPQAERPARPRYGEGAYAPTSRGSYQRWRAGRGLECA